MAQFYERYWAERDGTLDDFDLKWPYLAPHLPRQSGITILDLGCGNGAILHQLQKLNPNASYIGLDVSAEGLRVARQNLPGVNLMAIEDGGKFPLADASVDFIFSSEVIEHIYDTRNAFQEMGRVLKPGGSVLLTTPHHGFVKNLMLTVFGFDSHFDPMGPHVRFFSKRTLDRALRQNGIVPQRWGYYGRFYPVSHSIYVIGKKS